MEKPSQNPEKMSSPQWKRRMIAALTWILIFVLVIYFGRFFQQRRMREIDITYPDYQQLLVKGALENATIEERVLHGELKYEEVQHQKGKEVKYTRFKTILPFDVDRTMVSEWDKGGVHYEIREKSTEWWGYALYTMLPWLLLASWGLFIWRKAQGGAPKGIFTFGKSRAKLLTENRPKTTFKDVAGADEAKQELQEVIEFLKEPEKFQTLGGRIPKGVLLLGPPGTGKTLLAKAVAGEAGVPFFSISGADFVEMFVGVGASRVRDLFDQGKKSAPCIIFIDEIDAVGRHRGAGLGGGHDEREQTLNQLLVEMDGFDTNEGVILIAATNRPDVLDSALLRPGRFDRQVVVDRPDFRGREGILKVHTRKIPLASDVDLMVLAKGTPGFSGADLANIVNEAALLAARKGKKHVEMTDFEEAKDKVMMGVERKSLFITEDEKKATAYHESGHVLVSKLIPGSDPVHKVTIIPRGRALGVTSFLPIDEKHTVTKSYCETLMAHLMGGRIAERFVTGELSTGAGNDIERATELARKMVCEWGMSDKIGPVSFGKKSEEIFLGREIAQHRDYSEQTAILIDQEIKRIIREVTDRAERLIRANEEKLHKLAAALLEREILDGDEIEQILNGKTVSTAKPAVRRRRSKPAGPETESSA
jgi:cell division protease FtsH